MSGPPEARTGDALLRELLEAYARGEWLFPFPPVSGGAVNLHANHYRFGVDELAENTHGWYAAEDANPAQGAIPVDTTFLLRFNVQETGGTAASNVDNQFQCRRNGGAWQDVTTTSTISRAVAAVALTNGGNCTKRLSGTGTFETTGAGQTEDGLSGGAPNDIVASGCSETECGLQIRSADTAPGDLIEFQLTSPDFPITMDLIPAVTLAGFAPEHGQWRRPVTRPAQRVVGVW